MQEQFTVLPTIRPDDNPMTDGHSARCLGDDLSAPRRLSQLLIVGQRDPIDHEHPHPGRVMNAASQRIGDLPRCKCGAIFENDVLLRFRPLEREWRQACEFFLINHAVRH